MSRRDLTSEASEELFRLFQKLPKSQSQGKDIELRGLEISNKDGAQQEEQGTSIFDLPLELLIEHTGPDGETVSSGIGSYLSVKDQAALACTSRFFYSLFSAALDTVVNQLLQHVVHGEQKEAEKLIQDNPELLLKKGRVTDYSGRMIEGTAFQMALGAEDVEMAKMIAHYLDQLNPDEKLKQYQEQFPEGWEEAEALRHKQDLEALNTVVYAISDFDTDKHCEPALQAFRDYLKGQTQEVITTGKHFNVQLLVKAFQLYDQNYGGFVSSRQNNLFWCKVIGYIQRFLPACYAQAFAQGVYFIIEECKKLPRSFGFRYCGGSYFPLDSNSNFRMGYNCAVAARGRGAGGLVGSGACQQGRTYQNYVKQKQQDCTSLCNSPTSSQSPSA